MKKIILVITLAIFSVACNQLGKNEYIVTGNANGIENGNKVFIELQSESGPMAIDTTVIENGNFEFKGNFENIEIAYIKIESENSALPFILEEGKININYATDSLHKSKISGTLNNEKFQEFTDESTKISKKLTKFQKNNLERMQTAKATNDTATVNSIMKEHDSFQTELNGVSKKFASDNPKAFISVLLVENLLTNQNLPIEEIKTIYKKLDKSLLETKSGKKVKQIIEALESVKIGSVAPDFSAKNPEGKVISLKESLGKVTIIDFWASWCGPCRAENPNVVAMYNELHEKGLNIIGVSLDKDAAKWAEAIQKDGLNWAHISNLQFWQEPIAEQYNVKSIPATYILDEKGIIVAKDLRGDALKTKVKELLGL